MIKSANLAYQLENLPNLIEDIEKLLQSGSYVSSGEVLKFEEKFSKFHKIEYGVGVNSGTSALHTALVALNIGTGDEVVVPSHTFIASIISIILAGGQPVLVDVNEHGLIDFELVEKAVTKNTKAILPVHLYGSAIQESDMQKISQLGIPIVEDCSQAHGAKYLSGKGIGHYSAISAFSLYPGKGLGGIGEGGICLTQTLDYSEKMKRFRNWGTTEKYYHDEFGINYRMDEIQALVLSKKLEFLTQWNIRRQEIANYYYGGLKNVKFINFREGSPVFHQFVISHHKRAELQIYLLHRGIETLIHYPVPNHLQKALRGKVRVSGDLKMTENLSAEILSLPIYPGLLNSEIEYIIETVNSF